MYCPVCRSRWPEHAESYEGSVGYRDMRRSLEHQHSSDAFIWDEVEWWEGDSVNSVAVRPCSGIPLHRYKHQKFNQWYDDRLREFKQLRELQKKKQQEKTSVKPPVVKTTPPQAPSKNNYIHGTSDKYIQTDLNNTNKQHVEAVVDTLDTNKRLRDIVAYNQQIQDQEENGEWGGIIYLILRTALLC